MRKVEVRKPVLVSNQERASENRKVFDKMKSLVINIISSPGAGKTSFIAKLVEHFRDKHAMLVIEGDIRGQVDSDRLSEMDVDVIQINTLTECHLDAFMVAQALPQVKKEYGLILIENVGNLVCPAEFEIGEDFKLAILSTPEGDDKPLKYPLLFHLARVVVINKIDLLPYVDFDIEKAKTSIHNENPRALIYPISSKTGDGLGDICKYVTDLLESKRPR